ncbi:MAG: hypothetical protein GOVbin1709_67 [Prokaryotic dsDNA virus sp.]|nr:MAG: hypothetical protein GOVbin1709_67 [Prokaryotic dsDNA virus sp.]|tara:strand:+ start:14290 stop:14433 length:144 start_codon:yes stop_codon:yes gene_type:complete
MYILILILVIIGTILLAKYALEQGLKIEDNKKFMKNMKNFDKPNKNK